MPGRGFKLALLAVMLAAAGAHGAAGKDAPQLDYGFFKARVEPIFLRKRPDHARCVVCHAGSNNALSLERLDPGSRSWTEAQSQHNFAVVSKLVTPGDPEASRLLLHPLAPEGGGDVFHSGGRQFASKNDPDWKTLARWVNGATLGGRKR